MGNFCVFCESTRKIEIEIEELPNDIAGLRLVRSREVLEVKVESGRTTTSRSGGGGISDQTTAIASRRGWARRSWGVQSSGETGTHDIEDKEQEENRC